MMNKKSIFIRVILFPVYLILWTLGLLAIIGSFIFNEFYDKMDYIRDLFQMWVDKIAPLDNKKGEK
ncbi:hypothetical protein [Klebsiella phage 05F01]|nr:hypothetical protein [Klebsiella phage 05F01]